MSFKKDFRAKGGPPQDMSWIWLTADMLQSPAWRALSGNALKVIMRIALEHMAHGGRQNGKLKVTYVDFRKFGVRGSAIREAITVAGNLGFIERTSVGEVPWHGDGNIRKPSTYAITWIPTVGQMTATSRWTRHTTDAEARAAVATAKVQCAQLRDLPESFNRQKKHSRKKRQTLHVIK